MSTYGYSWVLIGPDGERHEVDDLAKWSQDNVKLFFPDAAPDNAASRISEGVQMMGYALRHPEDLTGCALIKGGRLRVFRSPRCRTPSLPKSRLLTG